MELPAHPVTSGNKSNSPALCNPAWIIITLWERPTCHKVFVVPTSLELSCYAPLIVIDPLPVNSCSINPTLWQENLDWEYNSITKSYKCKSNFTHGVKVFWLRKIVKWRYNEIYLRWWWTVDSAIISESVVMRESPGDSFRLCCFW